MKSFHYPYSYSDEQKIQLHEELIIAEQSRAEMLREKAAHLLIEADNHEQQAIHHFLQVIHLVGIEEIDGRSTA